MLVKIIFLLSLSLSWSCTSISKFFSGESEYREEIYGLTDMSLDYIESLWGKADRRVPMSYGSVVTFKNILSKDEEPLTGKINKKVCSIKLKVNKKGLVKKWNYQKCEAFPSSKKL